MVGSQVHGFPKVMGVLTHLDAFTDASRLRKVKKKLKARFWTEIYDGAKLFYLSGVQHGGWAVLVLAFTRLHHAPPVISARDGRA